MSAVHMIVHTSANEPQQEWQTHSEAYSVAQSTNPPKSEVTATPGRLLRLRMSLSWCSLPVAVFIQGSKPPIWPSFLRLGLWI